MQKKTIETLSNIKNVFSGSAVECISEMFGVDATINEEWQVLERLNGGLDTIITMGSAGENFKSLFMIATSNETLANLAEEDEIDDEYASDILGEFVNSYCAILDDNEEFSKIFGKQIQAVPILYTSGCPFMPFLAGIEGYLDINNGQKIYIGYTTQDTRE